MDQSDTSCEAEQLDLHVHLEFLTQLEHAIDDALARYGKEPDADLTEVIDMREDVLRAKAFIEQEIEMAEADAALPLPAAEKPSAGVAAG
ncbi:MAG: hypothetical protein MI755_07025 [Sphingomonadales bacterium]|nr:hypothetical protein [Sphingomonadales bacterium]